MLFKQDELKHQNYIQLNPLLMSIQSLSDSSENSVPEEVEEKQTPAIQNFYQEVIEPYNDAVKNSCEAAIASYLGCLAKENIQEKQGIEQLRQHVMQTLETHLSHSQKIAVIDDCRKRCTCCYVIPPYLVEKVYQIDQIRGDQLIGPVTQKEGLNKKIRNLTKQVVHRANRLRANDQSTEALATSGKETSITIYDAQHKEKLPGRFVTSQASSETSSKSKNIDRTARRVLEAATAVHQFWLDNFNLNSFDDKGSEMRSTIHFGRNFANAFWNGEQMVFGDGNDYLKDLTHISIVAHEFGHAITGNKLNYEGEAGALNEHLSDVWGALVEQYKYKQTVHQASWLIGNGSLRVGATQFALRSMKAPGTAYDSSILGKDPQPDHYSNRYIGKEDEGGIHINSGIPNKAFYLFALAQGGHAWEKAGHLWFLTLQSDGLIHPNCTMREFAQATIHTALKYFPHDYKAHQDLVNAWKAVGLV